MKKILFIHNIWYESLGIMQVSACAKSHGHQSFLLMSPNQKKVHQAIKTINPDIIAFSIMTGELPWALQISEFIKKSFPQSQIKILIGGIHATFYPEIIQHEPIDIICRGEGDDAFVELLDKIEKKEDYTQIKNLWIKEDGVVYKNELRPLISSLDSLPFADRDLFYQYSYFKNNPNKTIITSRGCPFECAFCFNKQYKNLYNISNAGYIRRRNPDNVIQELLILKKFKKTHMILFQDDIFALDPKWLKDFLPAYKNQINLPFQIHLRSGTESEETIRILSKYKCDLVVFAVETGSEDVRRLALNKNIPDTSIYKTKHLLEKYNLKCAINNMFCFPGSTLDEAFQTLQFTKKIRPDYIISHCFRPIPGTDLYDALLSQDPSLRDKFDSFYSIFPNSPYSKSKRTERKLFYLSYICFLFPALINVLKKTLKYLPTAVCLIIFKLTAVYEYRKRYSVNFLRLLVEITKNYKYK